MRQGIDTAQLMRRMSGNSEDNYEELWVVILNTKSRYELSKNQALVLKQAISSGKKIVMFQTFAIPIPYIVEFYRERRFLRGAKQLPARTRERPYEPIPPEKWEKFKQEVYKKIGYDEPRSKRITR